MGLNFVCLELENWNLLMRNNTSKDMRSEVFLYSDNWKITFLVKNLGGK